MMGFKGEVPAMRGDIHKKLLQKEMTRKEFLQFAGGSLFVVLGLTNLGALLHHFTKIADNPRPLTPEASHGFGSRKFGA